MPKKRNFLGGMQNYDPKTGEYESRLTKANGEGATKENVPGGEKTFSSFRKVSDEEYADSFYDKITELEGDFSTSIIDDGEYKGKYQELKKELEDNKGRLSKDDYSQLKFAIDKVLGDSSDEIDNQVMEMIESGKDNYEIKKWLEENDTSGDFDWYEADNYIDYLRGEAAENPTSLSGIDYWLNAIDEDIIKDDYNGDLMKAYEDELLYSYDRKLDEKSKAKVKAIINQLVETKYKRFKK